jgi:hypothetical protein
VTIATTDKSNAITILTPRLGRGRGGVEAVGARLGGIVC